jgi:hypothetical protein
MAHHERSRTAEQSLPSQLRFEEMPVAFAIDAVTTVLWNHRRLHGSLPQCVEHFADMFTIDPATAAVNPLDPKSRS